MNLKGKNMDSLEKENERLKIQNEILKESIMLLTKRVEYYKDKYERVVLDLKEMGK
jgi:predicted RNase H-like nuclease